jgi:hypothetical protein
MAKRISPAAERNRGPILDVLRRVLPASGHVLEIASGGGLHVVHFASALPDLVFQPSDPSPEARESIEELRVESGLANVLPPRAVDVLDPAWERAAGLGVVDGIVCINMLHIAPWEATAGLFRGAARLVAHDAPVVLYGPYRFHGRFLAPSNEAFSRSLAERNPAWAVRDVDDVERTAGAAGFVMDAPIELPANNHVLVFRFGASTRGNLGGGAP